MNLDDFDYHLPDALIARYPADKRTASRLLITSNNASEFAHQHFSDLVDSLCPGDALVLNDTRVVPARLNGRKSTGGRVELLLERVHENARRCAVHIKASKSPRAGMLLHLDGGAEVTVLGRDGELYELEFSEDAMAYFHAHGQVPLPPYLGRSDEPLDRERYQTVYASREGAVAAPTAGLHFDEALLELIRSRNVSVHFLTLHVGAGTFQNLRPENLSEGRLHEERVHIDAETAQQLNTVRDNGGRIVAVGTTTTRALESAATDGRLQTFDGGTELFIRPGYTFRIVDGLITNFHLPRSSLLMLLAAFMGTQAMQKTYAVAIEQRYRFYSYGDSMLAWRRSNS